MKILMICIAKIKYTPYIDFYINNIDCKCNQVDVVYWNRDLEPENIPYKNVNFIEFKASQIDESSKVLKIKNLIISRTYYEKDINIINCVFNCDFDIFVRKSKPYRYKN